MSGWVRHWIGMYSDPKWRLVARASGQSVGNVIAVFDSLMEAAGDAGDGELRGRIDGWDPDAVATVLEIEEHQVLAIFDAMAELRRPVHDGIKLTGWERRQPKRERDDDNSTKRVREHRQRQVDAAPAAEFIFADETPRNAQSQSQSRAEEIDHTRLARGNLREPSGVNLELLRDLVISAAGVALRQGAPKLDDLSPIIGLMGPGRGPPCDLQRHILPAIRAKSAGLTPGTVHSHRYWTDFIIEYRDACEAGAPPIQPVRATGGQNGGPRPSRIQTIAAGAAAAADRVVARHERFPG